MRRPEVRRLGQQHHVHVGLDEFVAGVQPHEAVVRRNVHFVAHLLLDGLQTALQTIREGIGHRHKFAVLVGTQGIHGGAGAAPAATDQADLEQIVARGVGAAANRQAAGQHAGGGQGRAGF